MEVYIKDALENISNVSNNKKQEKHYLKNEHLEDGEIGIISQEPPRKKMKTCSSRSSKEKSDRKESKKRPRSRSNRSSKEKNRNKEESEVVIIERERNKKCKKRKS
jgi:hypothetical protein